MFEATASSAAPGVKGVSRGGSIHGAARRPSQGARGRRGWWRLGSAVGRGRRRGGGWRRSCSGGACMDTREAVVATPSVVSHGLIDEVVHGAAQVAGHHLEELPQVVPTIKAPKRLSVLLSHRNLSRGAAERAEMEGSVSPAQYSAPLCQIMPERNLSSGYDAVKLTLPRYGSRWRGYHRRRGCGRGRDRA